MKSTYTEKAPQGEDTPAAEQSKEHAVTGLISRQAAIEAVDNFSMQITGMIRLPWGTVAEAVTGERYTMTKAEVKDLLNRLPPAEKTGHWTQNDNGTWSCDRCQSWIPNEQHHYARFCLYCGARMKGNQ